MMQSCRIVLVLCLVALVASGGALPALRCSPTDIEVDPRMARICFAFIKMYLEQHPETARIEDRPAPSFDYEALFRDFPQMFDTAMKRQDVVHNFLRFGRRR